MTVKILALATATSEMSVALLDEGHLIGESTSLMVAIMP